MYRGAGGRAEGGVECREADVFPGPGGARVGYFKLHGEHVEFDN